MVDSPAKQVVTIFGTFCQMQCRKYVLSINGIMNR